MKNPWKRFAVLAVVAAVALAIGLPTLHAGSIATGRFNLPFDANVDKIALGNGEYAFAVDHMSTNSIVTIYKGQKVVALMQPQSFNAYEKQGEKPVLVFIRHDGTASLRALRFPGSGTFYFPLPKGLKVLSAKQPQLLETISVEVSGD